MMTEWMVPDWVVHGLVVVLIVVSAAGYVLALIKHVKLYDATELAASALASKAVLSEELDAVRADLMESRRTVREQARTMSEREATVAEAERIVRDKRGLRRVSRRYCLTLAVDGHTVDEMVRMAETLQEVVQDKPEGGHLVVGGVGSGGWVTYAVDPEMTPGRYADTLVASVRGATEDTEITEGRS
jgi:hypothetical protein